MKKESLFTLQPMPPFEYRGEVRGLDALNRVCIPTNYLRQLGFEKGDDIQVEVFLTDKGVLMIPLIPKEK